MNGLTYRESGVDIDAADRAKERLGRLVESTRTAAVESAFGSFGGRFRATDGKTLVASADGVGTKLKLAFLTGRHDTVGEDLVNHCVNDILTEGAIPLVFMDYFATGVLDEDVVVSVVEGLARACRAAGCALLGGETAEMPDFYAPGEYDLAGFVVGQMEFSAVAERDVRAGDRLIGLFSNGLHTNGYSFARHLLLRNMELGVHDPLPGCDGTVGEVLLRPHISYLGALRAPCAEGRIRALAHVTGGGLVGNLGRVLRGGLSARVDTTAWSADPLFSFLGEASGAEPEELFRTLNMGIGMVAIVRPEHEAEVLEALQAADCPAGTIGEVAEGEEPVALHGIESAPR